MKTVVCIKQVPAVSSVKIDPKTKRLIRDGVESVINPFDYYALEQAVKLREEHGGEVIALSMGPKKAEQALCEAVAFGADQGVLLCDRRFAGSDTWSTSYALALAILKFGEVDLVLCGKQAIDGDTAQVGSGIAAHLSWSQASGVAAVNNFEQGQIVIKRMKDNGYDCCQLVLPGVISVIKEINVPRVPRLTGWLKATDTEVLKWDADDIAADCFLLGLNGSPTRVVKTASPTTNRKDTRFIDMDAEHSAAMLIRELRLIAAI